VCPLARAITPSCRLAHFVIVFEEITMFRTAPAADTVEASRVHTVRTAPELIPLVELELSLLAPVEGWAAHLAGRSIAITTDDIGRPAIARTAARQLLTEQREHEARKREMLAAADQQAEEYDRAWRAQLGFGVPAGMVPVGMSPAEALFAAELDSHAYLPRRASVAEDLLDNSGGLTFHSLAEHDEQ
jgi:hypothetical protein